MPGYYVYILKSLRDSSYYIGFSRDVAHRLEEHNQGKSNYTKLKMPWAVVYMEEHKTKAEALKRENSSRPSGVNFPAHSRLILLRLA
ncbi:MAG: GIY-YIG nuclease family protein [Bacteroidetes bacterium]|nr:GIY-YIG nuclease family protein [Bacteroidota bacterium]